MKKKRSKRPEEITPERTPLSQECKDAFSMLEDIRYIWNEKIEDRSRDAAEEFFESIIAKGESICSTIRQSGRVTPNQYNALERMLKGAKKWVHDEDDD